MPSSDSDFAESETFGQDASFRLEQPIAAMSISPSGRDVVLASKDGLHIIDLDSPYSPPRYLQHRTPWEVADVQWSPFARRDYWVVSTSNQKAMVWNLEAPSWLGNIEMVLHGHTRAITDINFSAKHPDILATCGVDSFVHCWDLRTPMRPAVSFSDWFAGATQVKYSRQDEHVLASSHDRFLHIWDDRKGAIPVRTIEGHDTKIYGVDWNRFEPNKLVTCSLDRTIKFWDISIEDDVPARVIHTPFAVSRARHTPFGWGMLAMPQRGNNDLHLYDRRSIDNGAESGDVAPVATFPGHKGAVKEFLWRAKGTILDGVDHRDFQLVSWGSDRELRLHKVEEDTFNSIGYEKGSTKVDRLNFTRRGARYRTFREEVVDNESPVDNVTNADMLPSTSYVSRFRHRMSTTPGMSKLPVSQFRGWVQGQAQNTRMGMHGRNTVKHNTDALAWLRNVKINTWDPDTLAEEISHVGEKFKKVEFESIDIARRRAVLSVHGPWADGNTPLYLRADLRFPKLYPRGAAAVVTIQKTAGVTASIFDNLATEVLTICDTHAASKKGCIEAIIRYLLREQTLDDIVGLLTNDPMLDSKVLKPAVQEEDGLSSSDEDERIEGPGQSLDVAANGRVPLPKACGALFAENGMLVCFFPERPERSASTLQSLKVGTLRADQSSRPFEGFGKLNQDLAVQRPAEDAPLLDDEGSVSAGSDDASEFSSSSSTSSDESLTFADKFGLYTAGAGSLTKRSRSADPSNKSTTLTSTRLGEDSRKNYPCLHNLADLLPSKRGLAESYRVLGPGTEVCKHNANVADQAGMNEIASVWNLANLILERNVPLEALPGSESGASEILVIARMATPRIRSKDSAINLSFDESKNVSSHTSRARVRWGQSPLSSGYLIYAMFTYFERIGDIQMLAMLSCIFAEPTAPKSSRPGGYPTDDSAMKVPVPAFCTAYYPNRAVARSILARSTGGVRSIESDQDPPTAAQTRSHGASDSRRLRATGQTHETLHHYSKLPSRAPSIAAEDFVAMPSGPNSVTVSLSTSPEDSKMSRHSASHVAYAASRASLHALSHTYSNSPPSAGIASSLKKFSPSGSALAPSSWVSGGIFRNNSGVDHSDAGSDEQISSRGLQYSGSSASLRTAQKTVARPSEGHRSSKSDATPRQSRYGQAPSRTKKRRFVTSLYNQNNFDIDGYAFVPLLDPRLEERYKSYRASYAHLLGVWQLPEKRAELLKFDGFQSHLESNTVSSHPPNSRRKLPNDAASVQVLQVVRCCPSCGEKLAAIEKNAEAIGWHCINESCLSQSRKVSTRTRCVVCETPILGLSIPCLQCGHTACYDCTQAWYETPHPRHSHNSEEPNGPTDDCTDEVENTSLCLGGCGCACPLLTSITVPYPPQSDTPPKPAPEYPPSLPSQKSHLSARSERLMSTHGPDKAIGAFLALSRVQSNTDTLRRTGSFAETAVEEEDEEGWDNKELHPWAGSTIASLGRGIGAGLSRGLTSKASDATIRKGK